MDIILSSDKEELRPARELARKFQAHSFYKKIGKTIVISDQRWQKALWDMSEDEIENLIQERHAARAEKNFQRADEIREELSNLGVELEDLRGETRWRRI